MITWHSKGGWGTQLSPALSTWSYYFIASPWIIKGPGKLKKQCSFDTAVRILNPSKKKQQKKPRDFPRYWIRFQKWKFPEFLWFLLLGIKKKSSRRPNYTHSLSRSRTETRMFMYVKYSLGPKPGLDNRLPNLTHTTVISFLVVLAICFIPA